MANTTRRPIIEPRGPLERESERERERDLSAQMLAARRGHMTYVHSTQPSIPPGSVNEYQLRLGRQRRL